MGESNGIFCGRSQKKEEGRGLKTGAWPVPNPKWRRGK